MGVTRYFVYGNVLAFAVFTVFFVRSEIATFGKLWGSSFWSASFPIRFQSSAKTIFGYFIFQQTLDLSHNKFTHFSCNVEMVWASSLTRLNLSYNNLATISWSICQLSCLQDLDVSHNSIRQLPKEEFWTSATMHKLSLSHNKVIKQWVCVDTFYSHCYKFRNNFRQS